MERSLFGFILRYSKREQLLIVPLVVASMLIYFSTLDLPKAIINEAIQGKRFPEADSTVPFLQIHLTLPHLLGGVKAPALVVWGSEDRIVPRSCGERYARALPNARLEIVEGAGHCLEMERPGELATLIDRFVT